ncbi:hypothetical protein JZ751_008016 [Albula glossodonta]|uniref:Uncharacterized protein n=1 Tax=Albula glossodonta TaxID=121402 RepID=A0A8T2NYN6_9TELE|nr:hypothetical protein JZ751_008016 [Albula glossodonta]
MKAGGEWGGVYKRQRNAVSPVLSASPRDVRAHTKLREGDPRRQWVTPTRAQARLEHRKIILWRFTGFQHYLKIDGNPSLPDGALQGAQHGPAAASEPPGSPAAGLAEGGASERPLELRSDRTGTARQNTAPNRPRAGWDRSVVCTLIWGGPCRERGSEQPHPTKPPLPPTQQDDPTNPCSGGKGGKGGGPSVEEVGGMTWGADESNTLFSLALY